MPAPGFWSPCLWEGAAREEGFFVMCLGKKFVLEKIMISTPLTFVIYENMSSSMWSDEETLNERQETNQRISAIQRHSC